jgi:EAL domain-containing protein (putative c-di-GMP-specific phosphodiesterase class I)
MVMAPSAAVQTARNGASPADAPRVLVVDDDPYVLLAYARVLRRAGYDAHTAADGVVALETLGSKSFDVLVSDIDMPRMDGLSLLKAVRQRDAHLPVLLITAGPEIETAIQAIDNGAAKYLPKPIEPGRLCDAVRGAIEASREPPTAGQELENLRGRFDAALESLWMAYQPIVSWNKKGLFGYEALVRTKEATLARPDDFFEAAERLDRVEEIGRAVRAHVARAAAELPGDTLLFVNLHPRDLVDEDLHDPRAPLSRVSRRVVLEITERASLDTVEAPRACVDALRKMGYRIAVDDLGAGYASLASLSHLEPDLVKIDMSLVRGVDSRPRNQTLIRAIVDLGRALGITTVTEGVETAAERDALADVGCDLLQGYLFGKPGKGFVPPMF